MMLTIKQAIIAGVVGAIVALGTFFAVTNIVEALGLFTMVWLWLECIPGCLLFGTVATKVTADIIIDQGER